MDSSIYERASTHKEGSTKAYNGEVGYHPLLAFWAEEGELLFSHLRRGSAYTARNILWFLRETCKRVPATPVKHLRADSGFYSKGVVEWCEAQEDVEMLAKRSIGHPADADQVGYCDLLAHMRSHVSDGHLDVSGDHDTAAY